MSRKKAKRAPTTEPKVTQKPGRPKGMNRSRVVLSVVETDNTFEMVTSCAPDPHHWVGKCIHCNTRLFVLDNGATDATLEHIKPLCDGGDPIDPHNLALACQRCNNRKGIDHDKHAGKGGRADEVIAALQALRRSRWREAVQP